MIETLKLALEALEAHADIGIKSDKAITALRTAIEQAEKQERVAWMFTDVEGTEFFEEREDWGGKWTPLYTTPPAAQRQWVGLTDESVVSAAARVLSDRVAASCNVDCGDMWMLHGNDSIEDARAMLEAAEAKLKDNT